MGNKRKKLRRKHSVKKSNILNVLIKHNDIPLDRTCQYQEKNSNKDTVIIAMDIDTQIDEIFDTISVDYENEQEISDIDFRENFEENAEDMLLQGLHIVNLQRFLNDVKSLNMHNVKNGCNFNDMVLLKDAGVRYHGLNTIMHFQCKKCFHIGTIETCEPKKNRDINYDAVLGSTLAGIGFSQLEELLSNCDIRCMSSTTYSNYQKQVQDNLLEVSKKCMSEAANEERIAAIERGDVDEKGTPCITVVVDGTWSKRSYGTNYSALSGAAIIIGHHTRKVLWAGVKNKYCQICSNAAAKEIEVKKHVCNINYQGPSTGMESSLLVEGFKNSEAQHNIRYTKMIGDGDSSTFKKLNEARIYQDPDINLEKVECVLHLYRNLRKKLYSLKTSKDFGKITQKEIVLKMEKIVRGIKASRNHWNSMDIHFNIKLSNLEKDIRNAPNHVFGQHANCAKYFCKKVTAPCNKAELLEKNGMMEKISNIVARMVFNAKNLLLNENSNIVEQFNSLVTKYVGGKRINFSKGQSYTSRVNAAVIQHNSGAVSSKLRMEIGRYLDDHKVYHLEQKREMKKILKRSTKKKWKKLINHDKDKYYGTETCEKEDVTGVALSILICNHLEKLKERHGRRNEIERNTIGQAQNPKWFNARAGMLTASHFGEVCRATTTKRLAGIVQCILYSNINGQKSIQHGRVSEQKAIDTFQNATNLVVTECGLFIDQENVMLGASPDGLVGDDDILEVKCPYSAYDLKLNINEAILNRKIDFWNVERKSKNKKSEDRKILGINKKHHWYYQIQGQLHISQKKKCFLIVWVGYTEDKYRIIEIERDDKFWKDEMEPKLLSFYNNHLLLEYVDPRQTRNMEIRGKSTSEKLK